MRGMYESLQVCFSFFFLFISQDFIRLFLFITIIQVGTQQFTIQDAYRNGHIKKVRKKVKKKLWHKKRE